MTFSPSVYTLEAASDTMRRFGAAIRRNGLRAAPAAASSGSRCSCRSAWLSQFGGKATTTPKAVACRSTFQGFAVATSSNLSGSSAPPYPSAAALGRVASAALTARSTAGSMGACSYPNSRCAFADENQAGNRASATSCALASPTSASPCAAAYGRRVRGAGRPAAGSRPPPHPPRRRRASDPRTRPPRSP